MKNFLGPLVVTAIISTLILFFLRGDVPVEQVSLLIIERDHTVHVIEDQAWLLRRAQLYEAFLTNDVATLN